VLDAVVLGPARLHATILVPSCLHATVLSPLRASPSSRSASQSPPCPSSRRSPPRVAALLHLHPAGAWSRRLILNARDSQRILYYPAPFPTRSRDLPDLMEQTPAACALHCQWRVPRRSPVVEPLSPQLRILLPTLPTRLILVAKKCPTPAANGGYLGSCTLLSEPSCTLLFFF
jgi:hypothetical protein